MLALRITFAHLPVSSATRAPKSAGDPASGLPPSSPSRALILGSESPALISALSLSTIATGVFLGTLMPTQPLDS